MPPIDNQPHRPKVLQLCISRVLGRQRLTSLDSSVASIGGVQNICPASSQVLGRRFAQHLKFRFVAYNVLARSQANKQSAYFLKKVQRESVTVEAHSLLNSVNRYAFNMLGTRLYWQGKWNELRAQVRGLVYPALLLTFSTADVHWQSLAKLMPGCRKQQIEDEARLYQPQKNPGYRGFPLHPRKGSTLHEGGCRPKV
ncbi:hypothetical protein E4U12_007868 [Claviceps purpurea]|nr:hypothetical protein E4U12_007868 [Claviceps purpurea]